MKVYSHDQDLAAHASEVLSLEVLAADDVVSEPVIVVATGDGVAYQVAAGMVEQGAPEKLVRFLDWTPQCLQADPETVLSWAKPLLWSEVRPINEWPDIEELPTYTSGFEFLDYSLRWRPPELVVTVGPYGSGKSLIAKMLALKWADLQNEPVSITAWEDDPFNEMEMIRRYADRNERRAQRLMSRFLWTKRLPDERRLLSWYVGLVRRQHEQFGTRHFVFDPWNEHDFDKDPRVAETEYVRDWMQKFQALTKELGIVLNIVTHVSARTYSEDGSIKPFRLANAYGSSNFGAKADRGICVLRTGKLGPEGVPVDHTVIRFDKIKVERVMGRRSTFAVQYDEERHDLVFDADATEKARKAWS